MTGLNLKLSEVAKAAGVRSQRGWNDIHLAGVSTDSRTIQPGQLFVALKGENYDGHDYLDTVFEKGATAAIVEENKAVSGQSLIAVPDTLVALGDLAAYLRTRRRKKPLKVVAVTGSNGKTTTKEMLVKILSGNLPTLATEGNFNNLIGLPKTLLELKPEHEAAVLELGMNRPGEIAMLTGIAEPAVGLITNIAPAHIEGLGSLEGVARAKAELFAGLPENAVAVVNLDDPLVMEKAEIFRGRKITFGFNHQADVHLEGQPSFGLSGTRFILVTPAGKVAIKFLALGRHNVANAMAAAAAAVALGLSVENIANGLNGFKPFPGRLAMKRMPGPIYLLDDTYNANPASMAAAYSVLRNIGRGQGRQVAVLGDMLELGDSSFFEHDLLGRAAAAMDMDLFVTVGRESKAAFKAAKKHGLPGRRTAWFEDAAEAGQWLKGRIGAHDRILVKGSRGMRMERVIRHITEGEEV